MASSDKDAESGYESWEEARKVSSLVSNVSSLFSTAIRFLKKDAESGAKTLSASSKYCLSRLVSANSFKAPVYFAAMTFQPESINQNGYVSPTDLASTFSPDEMATVVALLYLYRRIQKSCDEAEWNELSKQLHLHAELAGYIGRAIPNIGLSRGLILGSIRHLSLGLFLSVHKKSFVQYRRSLKIKKISFDLAEESSIWRCNHLQVASLLVQSLGLGGNLSKSITTGLLVTGLSDSEIDDEAYKMRILWTWVESLKRTGQPPQITHRGSYYPLKQDLDRLLSCVQTMKQNGPSCLFFAKGKDDISPTATPCLYKPEERPDDFINENDEYVMDEEMEDEDVPLEESEA